MNGFLKIIGLMGLWGILLFSSISAFGENRKFRRALVISGGGLTPGAALGMMAGARDAGYEADVIITTCGASLGAAIYNSSATLEEALEYSKSETYQRVLQNLITLQTRWIPTVKWRLETASQNLNVLPSLFDDTIVRIPEVPDSFLSTETFRVRKNHPRLVMIAARATFDNSQTGTISKGHKLYQQVYFTDPNTAKRLRGKRAAVAKAFPQSHVSVSTQVRSDVGTIQAARASVSDPFYINPARIGESYYFTGAVDLNPVELALDIAEEVLMTYPMGPYSPLERVAIASTFGFDPAERAYSVSLNRKVKWIDTSGLNALSFDPVPWGFIFSLNIPQSSEAYAAAVEQQFAFGYSRAVEAVQLQMSRDNVRSHLRAPFPKP